MSVRPQRILGIESSCDETGVALVQLDEQGPPRLLAHALHSQIDMHQAYGGVVPELASRDHIRRVVPLTRQVMADAGLSLSDVDLVAYTQGPGLAGALLVGAGVACALATSLGKGLRPEGLFALGDGKSFQLLSDDGDEKIGGTACKEAPPGQRKFRSITISL